MTLDKNIGANTDETLKILLKAGKKMTAKDHREQTIAYVLGSTGLSGPNRRKDVERCVDKIHDTNPESSES